MKRILLCLMVALFATGCLFAKNNDEKMNVMSYNIRYDNSGDKDNQWKFRRDFAADLVKFYEADVFGAQEVLNNQLNDLLNRLPEYAYVGVGREELRRDMDTAGRRKLLRLLDVQNTLLARSTLMSFTAGFKLAAGIAGELGTPYSFDADEEEKAKEMITNG